MSEKLTKEKETNNMNIVVKIEKSGNRYNVDSNGNKYTSSITRPRKRGF